MLTHDMFISVQIICYGIDCFKISHVTLYFKEHIQFVGFIFRDSGKIVYLFTKVVFVGIFDFLLD